MLQLPQPLHGLIRSHLSTKDAMALAAASTELLDLHRLGARHLTLRARPAASDPPPLQALASLLARQRASALRGLKVRVVAGVAAYPPAGRAAAAAVAAAAGDNNDEAPMLPMPNAFSAWPAAVGPPTGAGDLMLISEDEASDAEDGLPSTLAPASAPSMLFPPPLGLPPLPCLPAVVTLVLEAAEEGDDEEEANGNGDDDEEGRRFKRDNTLHATLSTVLLCPSFNPRHTPARASSLAAGLLGALLARGVLPSLHTLVIDGKDLLDEWGLERLGQAFEQCGPRPVPLTTLALEPPSLTQGRGLARMLLSGACDGLERLTLRRVNALGISAVARYLACPAHSSCLRSLALYRREGHLAWADPVAEALAAGGAPHLEALHLSFFPFGTQAADGFIRHRLLLHPLRELRLTGAGLREHDLVNLLLPPAPAPSPSLAPSLARLRVLRLDFRRAPAAVLAHALRSGFLPALETLGLVHCRLGDAGASELAEALTLSSTAPRQSRHLKCLDLAFNSIGAYGAQALARSCLPLPALEHLRLDGNPLGDAGVMCLVQALRPTPMCGCGGPDSKRGGVATAAGALHHGRVASAVAAAAGAAAPPALALDDTLFIPDRELLLLMVLPSCTAHSQAACVPTLNAAPKLRRLELRRVQLGRSAVLAMVQALCAGGAPELQNLVLGTPHVAGGGMAGGGDGSNNGYVEAGAFDGAMRRLLRAGRPRLRVSQEAGSLFMGLV